MYPESNRLKLIEQNYGKILLKIKLFKIFKKYPEECNYDFVKLTDKNVQILKNVSYLN